MYKEIQRLAEEALALQNKDRMDAVLKEIRGIAWAEALKTSFEDKRVEILTEKLMQYEREAERKEASNGSEEGGAK
jgi:hypothetical protein